MTTSASALPALPPNADDRSIVERLNRLIRDFNNELRVPPGVVLPFAGTTPPAGFLLCYGQAVSRASYADLFAAIGTSWGAGDGSTTFNLPDLRGRAAFGKDDMGGAAASRLTSGGSGINGAALGASGGAETHTLTIAQMPPHAHTQTADNTRSVGVGLTNVAATGAVGIWANDSSSTVGDGGAHNNMPPAVVLNHIIST